MATKKSSSRTLLSPKLTEASTRKGVSVRVGVILLALAVSSGFALWQSNEAYASAGKRVFFNNTVSVNACKAGKNPNGSIVVRWTVRNQLNSSLQAGFAQPGSMINLTTQLIPRGKTGSVTGGAYSTQNKTSTISVYVKQGSSAYRFHGYAKVNFSTLPNC
jgi:hypothetical protein